MKCEKHPNEELVIDRESNAWCLECCVEARNAWMLKQLEELGIEPDLDYKGTL